MIAVLPDHLNVFSCCQSVEIALVLYDISVLWYCRDWLLGGEGDIYAEVDYGAFQEETLHDKNFSHCCLLPKSASLPCRHDGMTAGIHLNSMRGWITCVKSRATMRKCRGQKFGRVVSTVYVYIYIYSKK